MSADIFISFATLDSKIANTICTALENRGFSCWISSRNISPGDNFQSSIVRAIRNAKVLLLVYSSNSNRSDEVTKELALASQQKLMVVPLRLENVPPSDAFAYEFATRQWIDLFADWEQAMNNLCARLSAALEDDRSNVDTIVLGKPTLQDPEAVAKAASARQRHRLIVGVSIAIGVLALIVLASQFVGGRQKEAAKPVEPAAIAAPAKAPSAAPVPPKPAAMATPPAPPPAAATPAAVAPAAAQPIVAAPPAVSAPRPAAPKPQPKKSSNLPY
ncbi:MAG: hypothetical protein RLZZ200_1839 [Pseudomonadota bacterium]|jgi:hypothetical protein